MTTQEYVKEIFDYDNGVLVYKKRINYRINIGKRVDVVNKNGYIQMQIKGKRYYAHRIIFLMHNGYIPEFIDHINGIRNDNRIENLREVSKIENHRNMKKPITNTSGVIGVYFCNSRKKWCSKIKINKKTINLGRFKDKEMAIKARKQAEIKYNFHENHGRD